MKSILLGIIFLILNFNTAISNDNIFYLDIDYILNNSNSGKIILEKLKNQKINDKKELLKQENDLKKIEEEISKIKNVISQDELQNKIKDFKNKISIYNSEKNRKLKNFDNLKKQQLDIFFKKINPYIEYFMKENEISIILDKKNIFIANSKYDITNSIIEILNNKIKD
jgi:outer membrane protein